MTSPRLILLACAGGALASPSLPAAVLVSNLDAPPSPFSAPSVSAGAYYAMSFTTGPGPGWDLASITLRMTSQGAAPGDLDVSLNADSGLGRPGNFLRVLDTAVAPGLPADYDFLPSSPITLSANTTYWIRASGDGPGGVGGAYGWLQVNDASQGGLAGWSIADHPTASLDQGASWFTIGVTPPLTLEVNGTAVPEPLEAAGMAGLGLLGFAVWRRRRRA